MASEDDNFFEQALSQEDDYVSSQEEDEEAEDFVEDMNNLMSSAQAGVAHVDVDDLYDKILDEADASRTPQDDDNYSEGDIFDDLSDEAGSDSDSSGNQSRSSSGSSRSQPGLEPELATELELESGPEPELDSGDDEYDEGEDEEGDGEISSFWDETISKLWAGSEKVVGNTHLLPELKPTTRPIVLVKEPNETEYVFRFRQYAFKVLTHNGYTQTDADVVGRKLINTIYMGMVYSDQEAGQVREALELVKNARSRSAA